MFDSSRYFADDEADKTINYLISKSNEWFHNTQLNRYIEKIKKSWSAYHGTYYDSSHSITFGGEQGELVNLAINHYRNIAQQSS